MSDESTNTLGKYQIIREIARSNDIVYEAIDPTINRRIALKELCMPPNLTGEARRERIERFWREGKSAGRLTHPNIVTIYEVGKDGERCFIAMEYLEGQTLRDYLKVRGALPIKDAVNYAIQLCSALAYAHANGIIHRDLKPENVQVLPGNYVKLTDFGIARIMNEPGITQSGQVFGTPSYMSPEQVAGKHLDNRSDIFSMGVLLYEMVTGQKPFTGDSLVTITYNVMNLQPPDPAGVPPFVLNAIKKAMAKKPEDRYQNAEELAEDLENENSGMPFAQAPVGNPSPFGNYPQTSYGSQIPNGYQAGGQSVPDPFAPPQQQQQQQNQAQQNSSVPPIPIDLSNIPYTPPPPLLSAETRNFLGIIFLIIGITGMLIFAGWAVNLAYNSYMTSSASQVAVKYYDQGQQLANEGKYAEAVGQWQLAIRTSPNSDTANNAYKSIVNVANEYARVGNYLQLANIANQLITLNNTSPEGYYYLGVVFQYRNKPQDAADAYRKAIQYGGGDIYAENARAGLQQMGMSE